MLLHAYRACAWHRCDQHRDCRLVQRRAPQGWRAVVFRQASSVTPHSWLSHGPLSLLDEPTVAALVDTGVTGRWHRLRMPALRVRDFRLLLVSQFTRGISY